MFNFFYLLYFSFINIIFYSIIIAYFFLKKKTISLKRKLKKNNTYYLLFLSINFLNLKIILFFIYRYILFFLNNFRYKIIMKIQNLKNIYIIKTI